MELCNSPNTNAARAWNCNCGTIRITSRPSTASPRTPSNAPSGCWPKVSSIPQVASNLGYGERWVRSPIHRYNRGLPMKNLRHQNKGQAPLLSPELQEAFYQALRKPHPRDGLWNIGNAAEWLSQRLGRPAGLELDAPPGPTTPPPAGRPRGAGSFQKKLFLMVFWLKLRFPWLKLEVFAEHRLGLKPIRRRVWAPLAQERPRYRWL